MKVAVILPSRGLMFSRTAEEVLKNVKGIGHRFYFSHGKPIPECFEAPTNEALKDPEVTHLWFVEDDMILPESTLGDMLSLNLAVVTANYPTTKRGDAAVLTVKGRIVYGGTGCLLVKREVFGELTKPYFRTDIRWQPRNLGGSIRFTASKSKEEGYGYHDVNFYINLFRRNIPVHKLEYTLGQRKLIALGKSGSNNGAHKIERWSKVKKDRYYTLIKNLPVQETGSLVEVDTLEGTFNVTPEHAQKLIKAGLGTKPPQRAVTIEDSEVYK